MGLFDKLKKQAMSSINELSSNLQEKMNGAGNPQNEQDYSSSQFEPVQQEPADDYSYGRTEQTPPPAPQVMTPPPAPQQFSDPASPQPAPQRPAPVQKAEDDGIYGNYMEHLIEMALADGELTEKEKQVLFKKAEANGIDLDEFEMVLDARLYERQKAMQAPAPVAHDSAPKSNKIGDVRKCPACGAMLESFTTRCPDCGHELNGIGVVSSFWALSKKLEEFDEKTTSNLMISHMTGGEQRRIQKKKQIIINFPFPTTREDILEFLSMGLPLCKKKGSFFMRNNIASPDYEHNQLASAWKSKLEQLVVKARLSMKDDKSTLAEIETFAQELDT